MAEENLNTVFQIQRIYLKDLSLEQPNSPGLLLEMTAPKVDINLGVGAETISENHYEVVLTATVTAKIGDKVYYNTRVYQIVAFDGQNGITGAAQPTVAAGPPGTIADDNHLGLIYEGSGSMLFLRLPLSEWSK